MTEDIHLKLFVKKLLETLNKSRIDYMLIGGIAAIYYGRPRSTMDCDVVVSMEQNQIKDFCKVLRENEFSIRDIDIELGFKEKSHFNAYLEGYPYRVDFSWKHDSLTRHGFERAKRKDVFGIVAVIEEPEDIVVAKLVYGSEQDFDDALAILLEQKKLDKKYLEKRAKEEDVFNKLQELYKKAED